MHNPKSLTNRLFALFCLSSCGWLFGYSVMYSCSRPDSAIFWARLGFSFIAFIPVLALHFVLSLIQKRLGIVLWFLYSTIPFALYLGWTKYIYSGVEKYFWGYYPVAGSFYIFFLLLFIVLFTACMILSFRASIKAVRDGMLVRAQQLRYVFYAFIAGSTAIVDYVVKYRLSIYPWGYLSAFIFIALIAYAVIRYRLMDIRVAFTSVGLFLGVYALALGIPFYLYIKEYHLAALWCAIILATVAPFTYIYVQQKAKEKLLSEQRAYQETLRQASAGMGRIRDLKRLLNLIVSILTRAVRMEHAFVYLWDGSTGSYKLASARRCRASGEVVVPELSANSKIVEAFGKFADPLILEEVRSRAADAQDRDMDALAAEISELMGALIFPIYSRSELIAVVVMGKKDRGRLYTEDDLATFSILANQAALAIENANYYDDMRRTQEQLFQAEKLATVGTMADGLSHQVNNRFHALGFIAGDLLDTVAQYEKDPVRFPLPEVLEQLRKGLTRIEENVTQGAQVVRGLLDYSRSKTTEKSAVDLKKLLNASLDMVGLKVRLSDFSREIDFPEGLPPVFGHFVQLQEVFFNLIDNAHFSMMDKKHAGSVQGYEPRMTFSARAVDNKIHITVTDNGMGVRPEDQRKLFMPFFTTKVSSRSGNGLGLFVMRKIIEEGHGGAIRFASEYTKGVEIQIVLPIVIM
ncbi:MAG: GAF domain-containing protein [Candidatus Omnitrophica bacterium]|nr:GAF domain-containing protein [Candidatus Omnitrophota bacterium]